LAQHVGKHLAWPKAQKRYMRRQTNKIYIRPDEGAYMVCRSNGRCHADQPPVHQGPPPQPSLQVHLNFPLPTKELEEIANMSCLHAAE
jgi:hypothetical protein